MAYRRLPWALPALSWLLTTPVAAQVSPYAGLEAREIKALSDTEIASYLAGDGMGLALAAELNGLPGPKHVLELADSLDLTDEQRNRARAIFDAMRAQAAELGRDIIAAERVLDSAFASGGIDRTALDAMTARSAALEGTLRFTHLAAHLDMRGVLTSDQIRRYAALRGYSDPAHPGHDPAHHSSQSSRP
jgi:Spy/CpxP family protein refolding chaperone